MSLEENKAVVRSLYEALTRRELNKVQESFTQGYVEHYPGIDLSREQADEGGYMFANAFPDVVSTIEDMVAEGDKVAIRVTHRGTHKGMYMGIHATGKKVEITNTCIFRVTGGKLAECWATPDGRLMQQLGIKAQGILKA
jgi:predicted ester cyclase